MTHIMRLEGPETFSIDFKKITPEDDYAYLVFKDGENDDVAFYLDESDLSDLIIWAMTQKAALKGKAPK